MMPQDFPDGFEPATGFGGFQAADTRTATALDRLERVIVPSLAALTERVEALTLEVRGSAHHDARPLLAAARHRRHNHI